MKLKADPEDKENNKKINSFLIHILNSRKLSFIKKTFVTFYDTLSEVFENDSTRIFCYLKTNIHPDVTTNIVEHKFRGLKTKTIHFVEKNVGWKIFTYCRNKIRDAVQKKIAYFPRSSPSAPVSAS